MNKITVVENVLKDEQHRAEAIRARLDEYGVCGINLMSAPGSGKTTLLQRTITSLDAPCAVLVGDLQTTRDAERLGASGAAVVQINTGRGCHLNTSQVMAGLDALDLTGLGYLFIENVGNMVCPAGHDLGEHRSVAALSVPEGDDKIAKYPTLFQRVDAVLFTKIDLLAVLSFDRQRMEQDLAQINSRVPLLPLSTNTGEGFEAWIAWLQEQRQQLPLGAASNGPGS